LGQVVGTDRREVPFRLVATNLSMTQCLARLRGIHGQGWGESLRLRWDCPDRGTNAVKMLSPASNPIFWCGFRWDPSRLLSNTRSTIPASWNDN